jgi:hypothetical protein
VRLTAAKRARQAFHSVSAGDLQRPKLLDLCHAIDVIGIRGQHRAHRIQREHQSSEQADAQEILPSSVTGFFASTVEAIVGRRR